MRLIIIVVVLSFVGCKSYPQSNGCDTVYRFVDEMPKYKNNGQDLMTDFYKLKIEKDCKPEELQQVVWVINKEGKISNVEVIGPSSEHCKNYVIQHAKTLTEWTPGKKDGKPVCVKIVLAVNIRPTNR
ncbi:MAG TPA: energy transducer TonB [Chryseosolibacter sp.]